MKKNIEMVEVDDLAIYEPVNSEYREQAFMKWRAEGKTHEACGIQCKSRDKKLTIRERMQMLQP
jgi:hypothetical protein